MNLVSIAFLQVGNNHCKPTKIQRFVHSSIEKKAYQMALTYAQGNFRESCSLNQDWNWSGVTDVHQQVVQGTKYYVCTQSFPIDECKPLGQFISRVVLACSLGRSYG